MQLYILPIFCSIQSNACRNFLHSRYFTYTIDKQQLYWLLRAISGRNGFNCVGILYTFAQSSHVVYDSIRITY